MSDFKERPVDRTFPVILELTPALLLKAINMARQEEYLDPIPDNARFSVKLPQGGDLSGSEFLFGDDTKFLLRWEGSLS